MVHREGGRLHLIKSGNQPLSSLTLQRERYSLVTFKGQTATLTESEVKVHIGYGGEFRVGKKGGQKLNEDEKCKGAENDARGAKAPPPPTHTHILKL